MHSLATGCALTPSGSYSIKSTYTTFFIGTINFSPWRRILEKLGPLCCKFFIWLVVHNRCWMADHLSKHGLPDPEVCPFYDQAEEIINHLLVGCVFSCQVQALIFQHLGIMQLAPEPSVSHFSGWRNLITAVPK